jgi:DedD protein
MDARAKQRLTGAIILVALVVLLVPELLTGPAATPAPGADDEGMREVTIDIDAPSKPSGATTPPDQVSLPAVSAPTAAPAPAPTTTAASPAPAPTPSAPTPAITAPAPTAPREAASAAAPSQTAAPPPTSAPVVVSPKPARGSFAVQLGSFSNQDNAQRLVGEMKAKGFSAFIAPITSGGRELYRVRIGPTSDRAGAEALAVKLRAQGQPGSVVPIS